MKRYLKHMRNHVINPLMLVIVVIVAIIPLAILLENPLNINTDNAYFVDSGRRILMGERPYVDFFNVNLITIQYLYVIPVSLSTIVGIHAGTLWMLLAWIQMIITMYLSYYLSRSIFTQAIQPFHLIAPMTLAFVSWLSLLRFNFSQREHLFILYALPWIIMRFGVYSGKLSDSKYHFLFGFVFAIIVSIKPYFALGVVILEIYWLIRFKNWKSLLSYSVYGGVVATALYFIFLLLNLDMVSGLIEIVRVSVDGYENYKRSNISKYTRMEFQIPMIVIVTLSIIAMAQNSDIGKFIGGIATLGFVGVLIVAMQDGVNSYYYFVMYGAAIFGIGFIITIANVNQSYSGLLFLQCLGLFILVNTILNWDYLTTYPIETPSKIQKIVNEETQSEDGILFLSAKLGDMQPWLHITNRYQASSYMGTWLPLFLIDEPLNNPQIQQFINITQKDIEKSPPIIIIDTFPLSKRGSLSFLEDSGLADIIYSRYQFIQVDDRYEIYRHIGTPPPQSIYFEIGEQLQLYSWQFTPSDSVSRCDDITITTWWNGVTEAKANYELSIHLLMNDEEVQRISGIIGGTEDYTNQTTIIDQRSLTIPCDAKSGDYNLLLSINNLDIEDYTLPVTDSNGANYGDYVFFKNFMLR